MTVVYPLRLGTLPPEHNWGSVVKEEGDGCRETTTGVFPRPEEIPWTTL